MNNVNKIKIISFNVNDFVEIDQPDNQDIGKFRVRTTNQSKAKLDYSDGEEEREDARTLEVLASHRPENEAIHVVIDWSQYGSVPKFLPDAGGPTLTWTTDIANKTSTIRFPVPSLPLAWFEWDTIGGEIPGFDLRVRIKRQSTPGDR